MIVQWSKFCRLNDRYDYLSNKFIEAMDAKNWIYAKKLCPMIDAVYEELMEIMQPKSSPKGARWSKG